MVNTRYHVLLCAVNRLERHRLLLIAEKLQIEFVLSGGDTTHCCTYLVRMDNE